MNKYKDTPANTIIMVMINIHLIDLDINGFHLKYCVKQEVATWSQTSSAPS